MEDEIGTEDLNSLPIKSFVYGPLEYDMEKANVSIGRLSCFGLKDTSDVFSLPEIVQEMKMRWDETVNTRVIFGAVKKDGNDKKINCVLTFDEEIINVGDGMDIQSGKFKAPKDGYYIFTFSETAYNPDENHSCCKKKKKKRKENHKLFKLEASKILSQFHLD